MKLLKIRRSETRLVSDLFAIEFFQGAGMALFFTAASTFFIQNFNIRELAVVFIIASILLWSANSIYTWLEHKLPVSRLSMVITIFMALSILLFGLGSVFIKGNWFWYALMSWYYVLYLYSNLDFWGIASLLFDVRQSKRLFGVISAGEIPAKFIGYSMASFIVIYIGTANLIFAGFLFMLCSLPFLYRVSREGSSEINVYELPYREKHKSEKMFKLIFKSFTTASLTETIAIISFLFALCLFILNFAFYSEIKTAFHDDIAIARFISMFLAFSRILALLIKLIFTSRLITTFGYKRTLLLSPILLSAIILVLLYIYHFTNGQKSILYIFGSLFIFADILGSSVNNPVFLTLMQPMHKPERLKAHNIIKGLMDPLAYLVTGILLYIIIEIMGHADLVILSYILLIIMVFIVVGIIKVNKQYLNTLVHSITTRFFNEEQLNITDTESLHVTRKKLRTGTELEKIYILNLLEKQSMNQEIIEMIIGSLESRSALVITEAIKICSRLNLAEAIPVLKDIIRENIAPEVTAEAVRAISKMACHDEDIKSLTTHGNMVIRHAAILGSLMNKDCTGANNETESLLGGMVSSENKEERISTARLLGELKDGLYGHFLEKLLEDKETEVRKAAIISAGKNNNPKLLKTLLKYFQHHEREVIIAFDHAGENAVPAIKSGLLSSDLNNKQFSALLRLCGKIGGKKTCLMLVDLLDELPAFSVELIRTLHKCNFKADPESKDKIESFVLQYISSATEIINIRNQLVLKGESYDLLDNSLKLEMDNIKEILLDLFSLLFGSDLIDKIMKGLHKKKKSSMANAMELIEMTIPKNFAVPFINIFESEDIILIDQPMKSNKVQVVDMEFVFNTILLSDSLNLNKWTKASCLYCGLKNSLYFHKDIIRKYIDCNEPMIREIAFAATKL